MIHDLITQGIPLAALTAFCAVWVAIASRRRNVRHATQRRNLRRAIAQEQARNYTPERVTR